MGLIILISGCSPSPYDAYLACNQIIAEATDLLQIDCHNRAADFAGEDNSQAMLEMFKDISNTDYELVRQHVDGDSAVLRLKQATAQANDQGFSAYMVKEGGRWMVERFKTNTYVGNEANADAQASLSMSEPYRMKTNQVVIQRGMEGASYWYSFIDLWDEVSVTLQLSHGRLVEGEFEYSYRRETLTPPTLRVAISRGDSGDYTYHYGGSIIIKNISIDSISGEFDLWAENREQERVKVAGEFFNLQHAGTD